MLPQGWGRSVARIEAMRFAGRRLTVNAEPTGAEAELRVQVVRGDTTPPAGSFPRHDGPPIEGLTFAAAVR